MATRSLNKVQLIGNLTRDPELRYTPQGTAVCTFGLATNRAWTTDSGEKREEVEFHRIVTWNKLAELCAQLLFKGRRVYFEGRLQTRSWTAQDGTQRQTTEIVANDMIILDSKRAAEEITPEVAPDEKELKAQEVVGVSEGVEANKEPVESPASSKTSSKKTGKGGEREGAVETETEKAEKKEDLKAEDIPF